MAIVMAGNDVRAHDDVSALDTGGAGYFYVGLDYSPAFSKIRDFSIRESNGETKAVYPYLKDGKSVKLESHKFDWNTPDPRIGFKDNMLVAMEGSVGYGIGGARVELEIGYERFKTKGIRDSGSKEDEADTVYLLAKELAYDVVTGQTDNLAAALAKTSGKDIVQFAKAVEISHPNIDGKVCVTKSVATSSGLNTSFGKYAGKTTAKNTQNENGTALCGGHGSTHSSGSNGSPRAETLKHFVNATLGMTGSNWPTSSSAEDAQQKATPNDNATAVAKDLVQELTPEEKTMEWALNISGL
ncbi:P44 outer membrane protein [Anaplasma phagocytophilum str. CRT38]|uniref:p44 outer membrane protein n=1 Tax=Anaplasma phagocytophilum str. CRT38 TaxID=1269275 RepID=S6GAX8_ANAPH|nr:P44 outer membrane protein [Anaplasma phagocytophilum str. CRT38]